MRDFTFFDKEYIYSIKTSCQTVALMCSNVLSLADRMGVDVFDNSYCNMGFSDNDIFEVYQYD